MEVPSPELIAAGVELLRSGNPENQALSAKVLDHYAREMPETSTAIAAAGGIEAAVACLGSGDSDIQQKAVRLLVALTRGTPGSRPGSQHGSGERCAAVVAAGGAPALTKLLASANKDMLLEATAVLGLMGHAGDQGVCAALLHAGALEPLAQLLQHSESPGVVSNAACATKGLVGFASAPAALVPGLLRALEPERGHDTHYAAACALSTLVLERPECCQQIAAAGGIAAVVRVMDGLSDDQLNGEHMYELAANCAVTLSGLAAGSPERCRAIVAAGGGPALARCLRSRRWVVVERGLNGLLLVEHSGAYPRPVDISLPEALHIAIEHQTRSSYGAEVQQAAAALMHRLRRGAFRGQGSLADGVTAVAERFAGAPSSGSSEPTAAPTAAPTQPSRPPRVCDAPGCGATRGLRLCGGCGTARYCSEACSRAHWREHRAECRRLQAEQAAAASGSGQAASRP